jgi:hypothetical protein
MSLGAMWRWAAAGWLAMTLSGCPSKARPEPFSCEQLQQRAEACEEQTVALLRQRFVALQSDASHEVTEQQFKMLESRFRERIHEKGAQKQCEKLQTWQEDAGAARLDRMKHCAAASGCDAFAACILDA